MSIGAIDGIIIDATVIMLENIYRHLTRHAEGRPADKEARLSDKVHHVLMAAVEVDKPILFSVLITIAAFLPLFTMQGVEGQIFGPMARTYAYALIGAVIATFTVTPVSRRSCCRTGWKRSRPFWSWRLRRIYTFVLPRAVRRYRISALGAVVFLCIAGVLGVRLGSEFLPKLEEGNLWIRAMMPPTITLEAGVDTVARIRDVIRSYEPVRTVFSEQGRGDDGTDPDGSFLAESLVPLKPFEEWPRGLSKEQLIKAMSERLNREFVGIDFNFSQYIQDNIEEAVSA